MDDSIVRLIIVCGEWYRTDEKCLGRWQGMQALLQQDWRYAFRFFLGRAMYQGRSDEVSERVEDAALQTLDEFWADEDLDLSLHLSDIEEALLMRIGPGKVGKGRDVRMVLDALSFVDRLPDRNIVTYSIDRMKAGHTAAHYRELQGYGNEQGITQVGPKIAAFYLRDVVSLFSLDDDVDRAGAACLQPVDTWVRRIAERLGIVDPKATDDEIRQAIVDTCSDLGVSPVLFNQGVWYLATHALDLFLDGRARIDA